MGLVMGQAGASVQPAMGGLSAPNLAWSLQRSLVHLGVETVDVFYLHQPDPETSLEETLRACHELHQQNKFVRLGLSNYMAEEVAEACRLCGVCSAICCFCMVPVKRSLCGRYERLGRANGISGQLLRVQP